MKCPICEEEYPFEFTYCYHCGFNRMRTEFVNEEERQLWLKETVEPCRSVYETALERMDSLDDENDELCDEIDELQEKYDELLEKYEQALQSKSVHTNTTPTQKDGWNYTDLVPHPNYAKCSYTDDVFEIYNITGTGDARCYKIQFLAKMLSLSRWGNGSGRVRFKWRLKDNDGIIVLTNVWCQEGLLVGDVIRGEIVINNAGDHLYTMDIVNA